MDSGKGKILMVCVEEVLAEFIYTLSPHRASRPWCSTTCPYTWSRGVTCSSPCLPCCPQPLSPLPGRCRQDTGSPSPLLHPSSCLLMVCGGDECVFLCTCCFNYYISFACIRFSFWVFSLVHSYEPPYLTWSNPTWPSLTCIYLTPPTVCQPVVTKEAPVIDFLLTDLSWQEDDLRCPMSGDARFELTCLLRDIKVQLLSHHSEPCRIFHAVCCPFFCLSWYSVISHVILTSYYIIYHHFIISHHSS